ncbi:hypothetical protein BKA57DRAFT_457736 [Linnemannia elongata]|nr:hypothetical protein BKA57DRAFT_457736 [Linnemannia elongata]
MLHMFLFFFFSLFLYLFTSLLLHSSPHPPPSPLLLFFCFINFIFLPLLQLEERAQRHRQTISHSFFIGIIIFRRYTITTPFFSSSTLLSSLFLHQAHTLSFTHIHTHTPLTRPLNFDTPSGILKL